MHDEFVRANAEKKFSVGLNEPAKQSLEIVFFILNMTICVNVHHKMRVVLIPGSPIMLSHTCTTKSIRNRTHVHQCLDRSWRDSLGHGERCV